MNFSHFFPNVAVEWLEDFKDKIFRRDDVLRILDPAVVTKSQ